MSAENDLKPLFEKAAKLAAAVPKELREAAFNRALDVLLEPRKRKQPAGGGRTRAKPAKSSSPERGSDPVAVLLRDLDRTAHPEIFEAPRVLERGLMILRAARKDHKIDGLSSPQIAEVLTEKFRIRTTRQALTQALDAAGDMVDRTRSAGRTLYKLMHPGEKYLDAGDFPRRASRARRPAAKKRTGETGTAKKGVPKKAAKKTPTKSAKGGKKSRSGSGKPGPLAMIRQLTESGFFKTGRTISDIQEHCRQSFAYTYKVTDLSPTLGRAIRSGLLKRELNADGQYEYTSGWRPVRGRACSGTGEVPFEDHRGLRRDQAPPSRVGL